LFNNRLATLTSVLDDNKSDLGAALTNLSQAVVEVQRFIAGSRDQTSEQIRRLADLTQILVDNKTVVQNILHVTPNALANGYNDYEPDMGAIRGAFSLSNMTNPIESLCGAMGAIENVTAVETGKLCALYAGPALRVFNPLFLFNFNYLPIPINPFLAPSADKQNIIYTEPRLAPGGEGPKPGPPELPPAVSAYTGLPGDVPPAPPPPPPGRIPGAAMPEPPAPTTPGESPAPVSGLRPVEGGQP
jgi:phospholipid/cholesterol/gamma-HCH transport system substrate-binding protein